MIARPTPIIEAYPRCANLFRLTLTPLPSTLHVARTITLGRTRELVSFAPNPASTAVTPTISYTRSALSRAILDAFPLGDYHVRERDGLIIDTSTDHSPARPGFQIYAAFKMRVVYGSGAYYLCIDHHLLERTKLSQIIGGLPRT